MPHPVCTQHTSAMASSNCLASGPFHNSAPLLSCQGWLASASTYTHSYAFFFFSITALLIEKTWLVTDRTTPSSGSRVKAATPEIPQPWGTPCHTPCP